MIDRQTVLILGAGASNPYGYPTGGGLRRYICQTFPSVFSGIVEKETGAQSPVATKKAQDFSDCFHKSSTASIDLFLARNPDFSEFGKKSIIVSIMEAEKTSKFREYAIDPSRDWYSYLYRRMTDELISRDSYRHFSNNKITFLTFNYDRSLEYFFEESLINSFQSANPQDVREQLKKITIHHIYGCIDQPQWLGGRQYRAEYNLPDVNRLYQNIKTVHEIAAINEEAQTIIEKAETIFFLGFGYAKENLQVLGIESVDYGAKQIFGTALGLSNKEHGEISRYLKEHFKDLNPSRLKTDRDVLLEQVDSLQLLKERL